MSKSQSVDGGAIFYEVRRADNYSSLCRVRIIAVGLPDHTVKIFGHWQNSGRSASRWINVVMRAEATGQQVDARMAVMLCELLEFAGLADKFLSRRDFYPGDEDPKAMHGMQLVREEMDPEQLVLLPPLLIPLRTERLEQLAATENSPSAVLSRVPHQYKQLCIAY